MMKLSAIALGILTSALAISAFAKPTTCTLGTACALSDGETATFVVSKDTGTNFSCVVTADTGSVLSFNVHGAQQYVVTAGGGIHEANPSITLPITGKFKKDKPKSKGKLMFSDVTGGTGSVTCTAAVLSN